MSSRLENFPRDIWSLIVENLEISDLGHLSSTSKKLHTMMNDNEFLWRPAYEKLVPNRLRISYSSLQRPWTLLCKRMILGKKKAEQPNQIEFQKLLKQHFEGTTYRDNKFEVVCASDPYIIVGSISGECLLLNVIDGSVSCIAENSETDKEDSHFRFDGELLQRYSSNLLDAATGGHKLLYTWKISDLGSDPVIEQVNESEETERFKSIEKKEVTACMMKEMKRSEQLLMEADERLGIVHIPSGRVSNLRREVLIDPALDGPDPFSQFWIKFEANSRAIKKPGVGTIITREGEAKVEDFLETDTFITVVREDGTVQIQDFGSPSPKSAIKQAESSFVYSPYKKKNGDSLTPSVSSGSSRRHFLKSCKELLNDNIEVLL